VRRAAGRGAGPVVRARSGRCVRALGRSADPRQLAELLGRGGDGAGVALLEHGGGGLDEAGLVVVEADLRVDAVKLALRSCIEFDWYVLLLWKPTLAMHALSSASLIASTASTLNPLPFSAAMASATT
jgi:hypothetical protein